MPEPTPAEHCGHLSPQTLLTTPPVECVLRPSHAGSHADARGCRWMTAPTPPPGVVRDQIARAIHRYDYEAGLSGNDIPSRHHRGEADAVLRVPVIAEALGAAAAVARVRAECDRIEAAVRANPQSPDFDGAYLAAIGHIRRALNPLQETT
ncbi:hypothetical protein [Streptomyces sp. NPDC059015]|uniref:hypothetical protein n=1 Tax=unclassified Streptomyces TaxID=2593676 RepID=UPI00368296A2